jgi:4-hydroxybenzoate polyprenyltransferase
MSAASRPSLFFSRAGDYLRLVRFSHSVFALPFALQGAWLAARGTPEPRAIGLVLVCCVSARTAAMAFNRLVDARLDALNPRTARRELPAGVIRRSSAGALVAVSGAVFVAASFLLGPLCGWLSLPVLGILLGYSFTKRFTWLCHACLGLSLALAPLGAWLAVRGTLEGSLLAPLCLAAATLTWVAGFDLIYACQDREFDARARLHSIPARFGIAAALRLARALHVLTILLLLGVLRAADLGWIYGTSIGLAALLLAWEHSLVRADDLSRVDLAFFTLNGWVGVGLFLGLALELGLS